MASSPLTPFGAPVVTSTFSMTEAWQGWVRAITKQAGTGSGGTVTHTGALTANQLVLGNGAGDIKPLGSLGTTTTVLHGNAAGAPTFGAVSLTADVSGDLPYSSLAQGSALSVLGVTGNATADNASIAAGSDKQVLRRAGTAVGFGAIDLASSAAVSGILPVANGGSGSASGATIIFTTTILTNAQIKALPTTPITLLAAPGSGFFIKAIAAVVYVNNFAGVYTNINTTFAALQLETTSNVWITGAIQNDNSFTTPLTDLTDLLNTFTQTVVDFPPGDFASVTGAASGAVAGLKAQINTIGGRDNRAVQVSIDNNGSGALTGGNAANTMRISLYYAVTAV